MPLNVLIEVHQLDRKIDPLGRRVGRFGGVDVFLAQNRLITFNEDVCAVIPVRDHGGADNKPFAWTKFDL